MVWKLCRIKQILPTLLQNISCFIPIPHWYKISKSKICGYSSRWNVFLTIRELSKTCSKYICFQSSNMFLLSVSIKFNIYFSLQVFCIRKRHPLFAKTIRFVFYCSKQSKQGQANTNDGMWHRKSPHSWSAGTMHTPCERPNSEIVCSSLSSIFLFNIIVYLIIIFRRSIQHKNRAWCLFCWPKSSRYRPI